jgi:hypothetical protein
LFLVLLTALLGVEVAVPHTRAARTTNAPRIDGLLDDGVWRLAQPSGSFRQTAPLDGHPSSEPTTFRVLYDDEALYVGLDLIQTRTPIVERLTRRDQDSESEWITVRIDTRGEGKTALLFGVNVSGVLVDAVITDPDDWNTDWDENFEARAERTPTGWSAELRIPFRALRFDHKLPVQSWGFQATRYIAQNQESDAWSYVSREVANPLTRFGRLDGLEALKAPGRFELRPFAAGEVRRLDATDQTSAHGSSGNWSAGLDLKWHITQDLILDGAVMPDFGQVEADQVILNLTNYETFLPEKRPLFLEGTDMLAFPLPVFYSRRIGFVPTNPTLRNDVMQMLVNAPRPAPIYGAAKVVGRLDENWAIGTVTAFTGRNEVVVQDLSSGGTSNVVVAAPTLSNVLRIKREWGAFGRLGAILTGNTTLEAKGGYPTLPDPSTGNLTQLCPSGATIAVGGRCFRDSYVAGVDGLWRSPSGDYVASGALLASLVHAGPPSTQLDGTSVGSGARSMGAWARVAKEGGKNILASVTYSGAGRTLDYNDMGFMQRQNIHDVVASVAYRTLTPGLLTLTTSSGLQVAQRRSLGGLDLGQIYELNTRLRLRSYWLVILAANAAPPRFDDRELGTGAALERGGYRGSRFELSTDPKRAVFVSLSGQAQAIQRDAYAYTGQLTVTLSPMARFTASLIPQITWFGGEYRSTSQTIPSSSVASGPEHVFGKLSAVSLGATLTASYTFAPRLSLQTYAQAFLAAGHFDALRAVVPPMGARVRIADLAAAPSPAMLPSGPDFAEAALNLNVVLRWEFHLGSTLFLVYSRSQLPPIGNVVAPAMLQPSALGTRASADVILLKLSYWWAT